MDMQFKASKAMGGTMAKALLLDPVTRLLLDILQDIPAVSHQVVDGIAGDDLLTVEVRIRVESQVTKA